MISLQYHCTFVITKKPALVHCYSLNFILYLDFTSFSTNVLFLFQDPIWDTTLTFSHHISLIFSSSWQFLNISLFFMTWTVLWCTGQVFCRIFLNFDLSNVFLMIRVRLQVFGKNITEVKHPSHHTILGVHAINMTNPGVVNHISFCLPASPIGKLLFFHFQTLFFGSKSLSLAHTQEGEGVWGINFHFLERGVSTYIYFWKSSVRKFYLLSLICLFVYLFTHSFILYGLMCISFVLWIVIPCHIFYFVA